MKLPEEEKMNIDSCLADAIEDDDYIIESIKKYLNDKYGCRAEDFYFSVEDEEGVIYITEIEWEKEQLEKLLIQALSILIDHNNGSIEETLDKMGVRNEKKRKQFKELYGWEKKEEEVK